MLKFLAQAMTLPNEALEITFTAKGSGLYRLVISPTLGPCPESATPEEMALREALATPLVLEGTAGQIDNALESEIVNLVKVRSPVATSFEKNEAIASQVATRSPEAKADSSSSDSPDSDAQPNAEETEATSIFNQGGDEDEL